MDRRQLFVQSLLQRHIFPHPRHQSLRVAGPVGRLDARRHRVPELTILDVRPARSTVEFTIGVSELAMLREVRVQLLVVVHVVLVLRLHGHNELVERERPGALVEVGHHFEERAPVEVLFPHHERLLLRVLRIVLSDLLLRKHPRGGRVRVREHRFSVGDTTVFAEPRRDGEPVRRHRVHRLVHILRVVYGTHRQHKVIDAKCRLPVRLH